MESDLTCSVSGKLLAIPCDDIGKKQVSRSGHLWRMHNDLSANELRYAAALQKDKDKDCERQVRTALELGTDADHICYNDTIGNLGNCHCKQ